MPRTTRTFVALPIPENLGAKLARLQGLLAPDVPGVRWSEALPFHATLAFLGDVADTDLNAVCKAVAEASAAFEPIELRVEGLGVFPDPTKARVVWVGLAGPALSTLVELRERVAKSAASAIAIPVDPRFNPHVTLGRLKVDRRHPFDFTPLLKHYRTWSAGSFSATEVVTFASTLDPKGPSYAALGRAPLRGMGAPGHPRAASFSEGPPLPAGEGARRAGEGPRPREGNSPASHPPSVDEAEEHT